MIINDINKESCLFENILKTETIRMYGFDKELLQSNKAISIYCEAIAFIAGIHPKGRHCHWEDTVYACTENKILYSFPNQEVEEEEPSSFIANFLGTNLNGEGTPMFICNIPPYF